MRNLSTEKLSQLPGATQLNGKLRIKIEAVGLQCLYSQPLRYIVFGKKKRKAESNKDTGAQLGSCGCFKLGVVLSDSRVSAFNLSRECHGVVEETGSQERHVGLWVSHTTQALSSWATLFIHLTITYPEPTLSQALIWGKQEKRRR